VFSVMHERAMVPRIGEDFGFEDFFPQGHYRGLTKSTGSASSARLTIEAAFAIA
jgi:hypothetical protein